MIFFFFVHWKFNVNILTSENELQKGSKLLKLENKVESIVY